jgi:hypothetical protein
MSDSNFNENAPLYKYAKIFGESNKGAHSYRFLNLAIVDVISTIILAFVIYKIFNTDFTKTVVILLISGIIAHRLFGVRTTIDKILF